MAIRQKEKTNKFLEITDPKKAVGLWSYYTVRETAMTPVGATKEAILLYLSRLQPDGILAFHISSWHTDLEPLAKAIAKECSLHEVTYESAVTEYGYAALWALFARSPLDVKFDRKLNVKVDLAPGRDLPLMTDERHSIVPYLAPDLMFCK